jgi:hypothetical protein
MGTNGVRTKESDLSNRVRPNDLNYMAGSEMALPFWFRECRLHTLIHIFVYCDPPTRYSEHSARQ